MKSVIALLAVGLMAVVAVLARQTKVIGGNPAMISQYPSTASLLYASDNRNFYQACVGNIIASKTILTAAHCVHGDAAEKWRVRVGSSWANSDGSVYSLSSILIHPKFNTRNMDSDIAILKTQVAFIYSNLVSPASIAGNNYNLADDQAVWAIGFSSYASTPGQLWNIQIWTVSHSNCASWYSYHNAEVTSNMLCAGFSNSNGDGAQCIADSGGPLFHNGILVGIYSWGHSCSNYNYPGVNTRISNFTTWIQRNSD